MMLISAFLGSFAGVVFTLGLAVVFSLRQKQQQFTASQEAQQRALSQMRIAVASVLSAESIPVESPPEVN